MIHLKNGNWLPTACLQIKAERGCGLPKQGGQMIARSMALGLQLGQFRKARIDETYCLNNIETRRCAGLQLQLCQRQGLATEDDILAGQFEPYLIKANIDRG